jgi:hypothetical protein
MGITDRQILLIIGVTHLNRQETKFAKNIDKIAKNAWRHKRKLGVLCGLAVRNYATA